MSYLDPTYITPTGFQSLKNDLTDLEREQLNVGQEIKEAKEPGKDEENVSLEIAYMRRANVDARISSIRNTLRSAVLIKEPRRTTNRARLGSHVRIKRDDAVHEFKIVGTYEANPSSGLISHLSPLGAKLLGARVGDRINLICNDGEECTYTVLGIES